MSPQAKVVIDSTLDIPPDVQGINVVPCLVRFDGETYRDGVDLSRVAFYEKMRDARTVPQTSQPPPGVFEEYYRQLLQDGSEIVSVHTASTLSGIYNSASVAAANLPDAHIELIDTRSTSLGAGWIAVEAAAAAAQGATAAEAAQRARAMVCQVRVWAALDSLEFVRRGGRVGWAAAFLGELLRIKPIITAHDGEVLLLERPRTLRRAMLRMSELAANCGKWARVGVVHVDAPERAMEMTEILGTYVPKERIAQVEAGIALGSHTGPGAVGIAILLQDGERIVDSNKSLQVDDA